MKSFFLFSLLATLLHAELPYTEQTLNLMKSIDAFLVPFQLSSMKLFLMVGAIGVIYFLRKVFYGLLERLILSFDAIKKYSQEILNAIRGAVELLLIVVNVHIVLYIYNDFSVGEGSRSFFSIIYTLFFTFVFYRFMNTIARVKLSSFAESDVKMKNDLINVGLKILNSVIVLIGLLVVLFFAGVNLTAVLSGLGIGGIAVAFAAKDTISNFFGTVSILVSDAFAQGDWVEVNSKEGVVVEIGLRVTTLRTFDNALISIPNGTVANTDVKNWSKRTLGRRIKMSIGVKYDSKSEDLRNAVNEIRQMLDKHEAIATENTLYEHNYSSVAKLVSKDDLEGVKKTLLVYLDEFGPSSINILIYCFSKSVVWGEWLETKEDVMHKIMEILEKNNLEFAFPSLSVYNETAEKLNA